jgi:signal transduction histidine kinase
MKADQMTGRGAAVTLPGVLHRGALLHTDFQFGAISVPLLDALASLVLLGLAVTIGATQATTPVQQAGLVVAALAALARHESRRVSAALLGAGVVLVAVGGPGEVDCIEMLPAVALLAYAAGAERTTREAVALGLAALAILSVEMIQDPIMGLGGLASFAPFALALWLAGRGAELLRGKAAELERRNAELLAQRADTARLAVELERHRLGGELQGTIAEGLHAMLAATARARSDAAPLTEALEVVQNRGRTLLDDMRGVLGILRQHGEGPERAPQPSLRDIDRLLAGARARGVVVSLHEEGDERAVADAPDRSAYRIIERALDWAAPEPIDVHLRWRQRELELEIESGDTRGWPAVLAAARERAAMCGGRVAVVRTSAGRTGLRAHLPLAGVRA